jgi:hypothetical protein
VTESLISVPEAAGKNLHSFQRSVASTAVEDQVVILGPPYLATYTVTAEGVSVATSSDHLLEVMAGGSLHVRVERVEIKQVANANALTMAKIRVYRLTSAGTGGSALTPAPHDAADGASGATAMTIPAANGTEGTLLHTIDLPLRVAIVASELPYIWTPPTGIKPWLIAAGVTNGLAFKIVTGVATTPTVTLNVTLTEYEAH